MSLPAAAGFLLLLLLSLAAGQSRDLWSVTYHRQGDICAVKGSTVTISCTYTHPSLEKVKDSFWFRASPNDPYGTGSWDITENSGRVANTCSGRTCTLTITGVTESDSAEYRFRFRTYTETGKYTGFPGVTLIVTDLQIKVTRSNSNTGYWLTCDPQRQLTGWPSYTWYNNGQEAGRGQTLPLRTINPGDRYTCTVSGCRGSSPAVYAPRPPTVSASPDILEGSSVTLTCLSDANPAASYSWSKGNQMLSRNRTELVLQWVQWSDSGEYSCTAENQLGTSTSHIRIDVKYGPKFASVSVSPSGEIVEGSAVTLSCSSDANPKANYTWYKDGKELLRGRWFNFSSISSEDSGSYHCSSDNQHGRKDSSNQSINVQYAPRLPSVSASPSADITEGSSVNLSCSSDANPKANYTWYKENDALSQGQEQSYHFPAISSENSGVYFCKSENRHGQMNSKFLFIEVQYAPRLPSVSASPSGEVAEGSSVNLSCSSDANPKASYTWYKQSEDSPKATSQNFTIAEIRDEHSGYYYCEAHNNIGHVNSTSHRITVAVSQKVWKSSAFGATLAVLLAFFLLPVFIVIWRRTTSKKSSEPEEVADNKGQGPSDKSQVDNELHYASVHFSKNQSDPVYSNVGLSALSRNNEEDEESTEYTVVMCNVRITSPRTTGPDAVENPAALYSTVSR